MKRKKQLKKIALEHIRLAGEMQDLAKAMMVFKKDAEMLSKSNALLRASIQMALWAKEILLEI